MNSFYFLLVEQTTKHYIWVETCVFNPLGDDSDSGDIYNFLGIFILEI